MRVHLLIIIIAVLGIADLHAWQGDQPYTAACGLGVRWDASENGWTGTWVRRGSSNTFDATWQRDGSTGSSVLTMSLNGSRVHIERRDASSFGGAYVEYDGVVDAAGTVSGTSRVPASGATSPFRAAIHCGDAARPVPLSPGGAGPAPGCGLGVRWNASENDWTGTWVRRGSSNTFDATWQRDGSTGSSVLTMSLNGSRVHIERRDTPSFGGAYVEYDGVVDAAGAVSGTSRVPASGATSPFRAAIQCGDAARSSPAPTADLGATLVAIFPSVCTAIWTRAQPGVYDSVTVCQGPGNASFRETLTVQSYDGKTVIISRPNYGQYRGALSADHRTIRGTCDWADCTPNYRWTAYIDWNWNDSPPLQ